MDKPPYRWDDENRDIKKTNPPPRTTHPAAEALYTVLRAAAYYEAELAEASAEAWWEFRRNVRPGNVTRPDASNGVVEGLIAGNRRFFEVLVDALKRDWQTVVDDDEPDRYTPSSEPSPAYASSDSPDHAAEHPLSKAVARAREKKSSTPRIV